MSRTKPPAEYPAVLPFVAGQDKIGFLDLSDENAELAVEVYSDIRRFTAYIDERLRSGGYRYLAGGYGEVRKIYSFSPLFDGVEPRRLHLGIDIWGPAGTPVYTPLGGRIHSAAVNGSQGNYGGTVILECDPVGFLLFGHLSLASVSRASAKGGDAETGCFLTAGDRIGELGVPAENGHWPPHLHFQVIHDLENGVGDYPGVCRWSERGRYLDNCPDPAPFLAGFNTGLVRASIRSGGRNKPRTPNS